MGDAIKISVLGAGAMGSFYGAQFQHAGADVLLLDIWQEHIDRIKDGGLTLTHPDGSESRTDIRIMAASAPDLPKADLVIVFVDTNALAAAVPTIPRLLRDNGFALTLQNGVGNLERLSDTLGGNRVAGGTSMNSCELIGPGHVRHVVHGDTVLGEVKGAAVSERITRIAELLGTQDSKVKTVADIEPHVWSKLAVNCAVNPLCALTGLLPGELQENEALRQLQESIAFEIEILCTAKGISLPEDDLIGSIWEKSRGGMNKPSMVQHLDRRRKTEIDALNGAVVRIAKSEGLSTPVNATVTQLIKGLESRSCRARAGAH